MDFSELFLFNLNNNIGPNKNKIKLVLGDINDKFLIKKKVIQENKIDLIFHAATYKHLNFLEQTQIKQLKIMFWEHII